MLFTAASLDALSRAVFGMELPLSRAAVWVTGRAGSADVRARAAAGRGPKNSMRASSREAARRLHAPPRPFSPVSCTAAVGCVDAR